MLRIVYFIEQLIKSIFIREKNIPKATFACIVIGLDVEQGNRGLEVTTDQPDNRASGTLRRRTDQILTLFDPRCSHEAMHTSNSLLSISRNSLGRLKL